MTISAKAMGPFPLGRCTGRCCRSFWLPVSPMELAFDLKRWRQTGRFRYNEIEKIADMVVYLRSSDEDAIGRKSKGGFYTCRHWNPETGDCMNYDNRPTMCREYPYGSKCTFKGCTLACEARSAIAIPGSEGEKEAR